MVNRQLDRILTFVEAKSKFAELTSLHVYSLSPAIIKVFSL